MGKRGPALDTLPDREAEAVRDHIRAARDAKGLRNADIAEVMDWDLRRVTRALDATQRLRASAAHGLFQAVNKCEPRGIAHGRTREARDTALSIYIEAQQASRTLALFAPGNPGGQRPKRIPAVLVHPKEIGMLAEHLANEIARLPGVGHKKRAAIKARDLERVLHSSLGHFMWAAHIRLQARLSYECVDDVFRAFGYSATERHETTIYRGAL